MIQLGRCHERTTCWRQIGLGSQPRRGLKGPRKIASGFPKIATADAAGAVFAPQASRAAGKTVTILHESSFIPPFDGFIKKTLAQEYEKQTGIKIVYEITAFGSLPTRIATIAETGSGADITNQRPVAGRDSQTSLD